MYIGCSSPTTQLGALQITEENLGKQIMVEGWAVNRAKVSAQVIDPDFALWIDENELHSWPNGYYSGGEKGRKIRVTGILTEDHALPVFIKKPGDRPIQGVPMPEGTDLEKASHRWVLKKVQWELIKE